MFIVEINDFSRPYNDHICINIRTDDSHFGNRLPFFSQNESAMSLYPKMFLRVPHTCITNFTLVSLIAHFFHLSAVLREREREMRREQENQTKRKENTGEK